MKDETSERSTAFTGAKRLLANVLVLLMFVGLVMVPFVDTPVALGIAGVSGCLYLGIRLLT